MASPSPSRPCGGLHRRGFLAAAAAPIATSLLAAYTSADEPRAVRPDRPLGLPGPYPGRVIEARNKAMIRGGVKSREAVKATLARGMKELTGGDDGTEGWRSFFEAGDVVGVKVVPNGYPNAHTSYELILEVIEGLKSAGVKTRDILVFDRYREELITSKIHEILPDGIRWGGITPGGYDETQLQITFPGADAIAGYDPDEFMEMNLVHKGHDPRDDRNLRSHLGLLVTRRVNKLVLLPVVKDHGSAGVTGALKNMSHGLVNNVARSHSTPETNACNQFIPQVVAHPVIRKKCVLQVMDGIRGVYQGGPFGTNPNWAWEYNALLLATDPVALDHIEWTIIDAKRRAMGLPPVGSVGKLGLDADREGFDIRQPQHIPLASNLGLGIFDLKSPLGRRQSIDHRVVEMA